MRVSQEHNHLALLSLRRRQLQLVFLARNTSSEAASWRGRSLSYRSHVDFCHILLYPH